MLRNTAGCYVTVTRSGENTGTKGAQVRAGSGSVFVQVRRAVGKFRISSRVLLRQVCCPGELIFPTRKDCDVVAQHRVVYISSLPHLSAPKPVLGRNGLAWPCVRSSGRDRGEGVRGR